MGKLAKYLKGSVGYIVLVIALLFLQAYCDLALPDYTSKIVNEGIQQNGIEDGVPEKLRAETYENLQLFLDGEQQELMDMCYEPEASETEDDVQNYVLKNINKDEGDAGGCAS